MLLIAALEYEWLIAGMLRAGGKGSWLLLRRAGVLTMSGSSGCCAAGLRVASVRRGSLGPACPLPVCEDVDGPSSCARACACPFAVWWCAPCCHWPPPLRPAVAGRDDVDASAIMDSTSKAPRRICRQVTRSLCVKHDVQAQPVPALVVARDHGRGY